MKNLVQDGRIVQHTASGAISSGDAVVIGNAIGVAISDIANTKSGPVQLEGVFTLPKKTGEAMTVGQSLYYIAADDEITGTATGNVWAGICFEDAASDATSVRVKLQPAPKQAANIADLDQDISATYVEEEVQAISDKVDALLAALKAAGLMANS